MLTIYVNGEEFEIPDECNILSLLSLRNLDHTKVVVEKNEIVIHSKKFKIECINAGDRLEILQFVGGG